MVCLLKIMSSKLKCWCEIQRRKIIDIMKSMLLLKYYSMYSARTRSKKQLVIYMADGHCHHGGLSDRLCGIVSLYNYCKIYNKDFRIYFRSPYCLEKILMPNFYNWHINDEELSGNIKDVNVKYISLFSHDMHEMREYANSKLKTTKVQSHIYTNMRYFKEDDFKVLFAELFKPSEILEENLSMSTKGLPHIYVSYTFRFQQLLGDFEEGNFTRLKDEDEKHRLIEKCLLCIRQLYKKTNTPILVTSDSSTFLQAAKKIPYVYIVEGEIRHMDFNRDSNVDIMTDVKSFVDLFMIAMAKEIYLCTLPPLYRSGFPETASRIYGHPYKEFVPGEFHSGF